MDSEIPEREEFVPQEFTCEVCGKEPAIGVAAVPGVPYSAAYGELCLEANAHPYWVCVQNTAMAGNGTDGYYGAAKWWKDMVDDTLAHLGKTHDEFIADVLKSQEDYEDDLNHMRGTGRHIDPRIMELPDA